MQYQVPQFIETEDRIVGPLTLKQFLYVAAAGGLSAILFFTTNFVFWIGATIIIGGIGAALAFVRINGQPLIRLVLSAFRYAWRPQIYVWQPDTAPQEHEVHEEREREGLVERIATGMALREAWQKVETGTTPHENKRPARVNERYQIFQRTSGEQRAARRMDYR